jgi:hypothetical protein
MRVIRFFVLGRLIMVYKLQAWGLAGLWLVLGQTALAAAEEVPFGGDSLLPWVLIVLTVISVAAAAVWMKRGGRF